MCVANGFGTVVSLGWSLLHSQISPRAVSVTRETCKTLISDASQLLSYLHLTQTKQALMSYLQGILSLPWRNWE